LTFRLHKYDTWKQSVYKPKRINTNMCINSTSPKYVVVWFLRWIYLLITLYYTNKDWRSRKIVIFFLTVIFINIPLNTQLLIIQQMMRDLFAIILYGPYGKITVCNGKGMTTKMMRNEIRIIVQNPVFVVRW